MGGTVIHTLTKEKREGIIYISSVTSKYYLSNIFLTSSVISSVKQIPKVFYIFFLPSFLFLYIFFMYLLLYIFFI